MQPMDSVVAAKRRHAGFPDTHVLAKAERRHGRDKPGHDEKSDSLSSCSRAPEDSGCFWSYSVDADSVWQLTAAMERISKLALTKSATLRLSHIRSAILMCGSRAEPEDRHPKNHLLGSVRTFESLPRAR